MDEQLKPKIGNADDLEVQFEEILTELVAQIVSLYLGGHDAPPGQMVEPAIDIFKPEIKKSNLRLLDAVSNTVMMDPT
jgi:hypothetical protein